MISRRGVLCGMVGGAVFQPAIGAARTVPIERYDPAGGGGDAAVFLLYGSDGLTRAGRYPIAAQALTSAGYSVFLPRYFEATGDQRADYREIGGKFDLWAAAIAQAIEAVLRERGPRGSLGVVGFSLGGALALASSARDPRIKAVVNFFGFFPKELARARRVAPTLTFHGDADRIVPVDNAGRIERRLRDLGVPVQTEIYPGEGHGLSAVSLLDAGAKANAFLQRYL